MAMVEAEILIVADTLAAIILAVGFLVAYLYDRRLAAFGWWTLFFALIGVSLATTVIDPAAEVVWRKAVTWSALFGAAVVGALAMHHEGSIPTRPNFEIVAGAILLCSAGTTLVVLDAPYATWIAIGPIPTLFVALGVLWRILTKAAVPLIDLGTAGVVLLSTCLLGLRSYWLLTLDGAMQTGSFQPPPHFVIPPNAIGPVPLPGPVPIEKPLILALLTILFLLIIAVSAILRAALTAIRHMRERSSIDSLSGLRNRGAFDEAAETAIHAAGRRPVAVVLFDIDHFKLVNDTGGHACGDRVIAGLGSIIHEMITDGQIAGRIGGEEFAILLPGGNLGTARLLAETIRTRLSACDFSPDIPWPITLSGGVAERGGNEPLHLLMARADKALYQAKQTGRDRIVAAAALDQAPVEPNLAQTQHG